MNDGVGVRERKDTHPQCVQTEESPEGHIEAASDGQQGSPRRHRRCLSHPLHTRDALREVRWPSAFPFRCPALRPARCISQL